MPVRSDDSPLRLKKQHFVRSEIWNAAVDLFAAHGYDGTTVDDIANAAGVSRRTFFRYFASKDDVMVQATDTYGDLLVTAVKESVGAEPLQIVERAVRRLAGFVVAQPRARLAMQIVLDSPNARGAQLSEYSVITERVAIAFADAGTAANTHAPTLLASLTFVLLQRVFQSWYERSGPVEPIVDEVVAAFHGLSRVPGRQVARRARATRPAARSTRRLQDAR